MTQCFSRRAFLLVLFVVSGTVPASAQPEAFLLSPVVAGCGFGCGGTIIRVAPDAAAVLSTVVNAVGGAMTSPYVSPDGRLLAWMMWPSDVGRPTGRLAVRDLVSGSTFVLDIQGLQSFLGSPARTELYFVDANGPMALAPSGFRRLLAPPCNGGWLGGLSGGGTRLLTYCQGDGTPARPSQHLVFDVASGQVVATLPAWSWPALNVDGSQVYAVEYENGAQRLRRFDVATGAQLADAPVPSVTGGSGLQLFSAVHVDHRANRVFLVGQQIHAFDGTSLQTTQSFLLGLNSVVSFVTAYDSSLDDLGARLYVTVHQNVAGLSNYAYLVLDSNTLTPILRVPFVAPARFVPVPKPLPPVGAAANVQAANVIIQWAPQSSPAVTTRYLMEVGSAPGLNDIIAGLDVGLQTSFSAVGVPSGRYYVRVRAGNYTGLSAPSNEIVVTIP